MYVRLGDVCSKIGSGSTPKGSNYELNGKPFFRSQNIYDQGLVYDDIKYISDDMQEKMKGTIVLPNDILLNITGGSMGRCAHVPEDFEEGNVSQHVAIIRPIRINNAFLHKFTIAPYFQNLIFSSTTGAGREGLPKYNLEKFCIFLPPLEEQDAILSTVENLFAQIDQLHALAQKKIEYRENTAKALFSSINTATDKADLLQTWQLLNSNFKTITQSKESVKQLRQTILQLAVQGKLTAKWREENPNVEHASDLLEKIIVENKKIKAQYGLRNQKALLKLANDEIPFNVPETWLWDRLGNVFFTTSGGTPSRGNTDYWNGEIPWLKSGELTDGLITLDTSEKITELGHRKSSTYLFPAGTLLIALYGATAGKLGVLTYPSTTNQAICGFFTNQYVFSDFLFYYLWAFRSKILSESWGQAQPNISQDYLKKLCFALPPYKEQEVIVSKVNQLLAWCDELEKKIDKRDAYLERIMQAVVKQAFEPAQSSTGLPDLQEISQPALSEV